MCDYGADKLLTLSVMTFSSLSPLSQLELLLLLLNSNVESVFLCRPLRSPLLLAGIMIAQSPPLALLSALRKAKKHGAHSWCIVELTSVCGPVMCKPLPLTYGPGG